MQNRVSIIVPVYNAKDLTSCVDSLIHQTYRELDIILVDDGSTDGSGAVCDAYRQRDSRVRVVHQSNAGVSAARNAGLRLAASPYVMFVDSDDTLELDACELLMREMEKDPVDLLLFGYSMHGGSVAEVRPPSRQYRWKRELGADFSDLYDRYLIHCLWNKVFVRDRILQEFDTSLSLGEDLLFVLAYMKNIQSARCLDVCLYHYQWDTPQSLTMRYREDYFSIGKRLYQEAARFCRDHLGETADQAGICHVFLRDCLRAVQSLLFSSPRPRREVLARLGDWLSEPALRQAASGSPADNREERLLIRAVQKGRPGMLYAYYKIKKPLKIIKQRLVR